MQALQAWCEKTAQNSLFQNLILGVIVFNAVLVGVETSEELVNENERVFYWINEIVLYIFIAEILIRLIAYHPNYLRFFSNGWNVFDFTVVALTFLPEVDNLVTIVRMARILRVSRLVSYSKELRLIIATALRSLPSLVHVILLLGMLFYVYGVLGVHLFRKGGDPQRWGHLGVAVWTMFQTITFENWVAVSDPVIEDHPWAWIFFASFILIGVFVGLNLFVATVMNNLEEVKEEHEQEEHAGETPDAILQRVKDIKAQLKNLKLAMQGEAKGNSTGEVSRESL